MPALNGLGPTAAVGRPFSGEAHGIANVVDHRVRGYEVSAQLWSLVGLVL